MNTERRSKANRSSSQARRRVSKEPEPIRDRFKADELLSQAFDHRYPEAYGTSGPTHSAWNCR